MSPAFLKEVSRMSELANKIAKIANMGSMATKGILLNPDITKWAKEGQKVQSLVNKGLVNSIATQNLMNEFAKKTPDFISQSLNASHCFSHINKSTKFYGGGLPEAFASGNSYLNVNKQLHHLDFVSNIHQQEIEIKKKIEANLIESIKFEEIDINWEFTKPPINFADVKYINIQEHIKALNSVVLAEFIENSVQKRSTLLDWDYLRKLLELLEIREEIKERQKVVDLVKSLKKSLSSVFRQFQINRRERFRKINSFLFKNLDDYHSLTLTSIGY